MTTYSPLSDILANGEWIRRGMVWHWRSNEPKQVDVGARGSRAHDLIACPKCLARMDERCKGVTRRRDHRQRLVKRVCPCGESLRPPEQICGFCRAENTLRGAA